MSHRHVSEDQIIQDFKMEAKVMKVSILKLNAHVITVT